MIFDWKKEFDEKTLSDALDLEDNVKDLDVGYELIYGLVDECFVYIGLSDDFKIESLECDCGKKDASIWPQCCMQANHLKRRWNMICL